jgi:hypothetical protein
MEFRGKILISVVVWDSEVVSAAEAVQDVCGFGSQVFDEVVQGVVP